MFFYSPEISSAMDFLFSFYTMYALSLLAIVDLIEHAAGVAP
jgi:hypothetical protein